MKREDFIKAFEENKGWLRSKDFGYQSSVYSLLHEMIENNEVERIKKGLFKYLKNNYDEQENIMMIYPEAVLCLFSAWHYYDLSTTVSFE